MGLDYSIWPGQTSGLGSSVSDLVSRLPRRALSARLPDGAGAARGVQGRRAPVLRHENAILRRQIIRVRYEPADRLWLAASEGTFRVDAPKCRPHLSGGSRLRATQMGLYS